MVEITSREDMVKDRKRHMVKIITTSIINYTHIRGAEN